MSEEWRVVPDTNGRVEASSLGRIRGVFRKVLTPSTTREGYLRLGVSPDSLERKTVYVHRLVAAAFIGPAPKGYEVNHVDGEKTNNKPENIEYVTRKENIQHAIHTLGIEWNAHRNIGSEHGMAKLTETDVVKIRSLRASGLKLWQIAEQFSVNVPSISLICNRKTWTHI